MPPKSASKSKGKEKAGVKVDSPLVKLLKTILKEYETKCIEFGTSYCQTIREALKKGIDEEILIYTFVMDPKDRKKVEYWDDKTFAESFASSADENGVVKKKKKKKAPKDEKPLVRVLPFVDALRSNRYCDIKEFFVWDVHMDHSDMMCLGSMLEKGTYELEFIELIDCFITDKGLEAFAPNVNFTKTLTDLILDFNEFGDRGCNILCTGLQNCRWLIRLSLCFCDLHKQSGIWLGNLVAETSIRELFLDGNQLEAEGTLALLMQLAESAINEGFDRERQMQLKMEQAENEKMASRKRYDLNAPPDANQSATEVESENEILDTNINAAKNPFEKRGKKKKLKQPPSGPQVSILRLSDNGINHMGRGGNFAPVRCMQLIKAIISGSKDLREIDLFGNEIGQVGARLLMEGILARRDKKLPKIGVRVTHLINQDTYDTINKLAPGPKYKKPKKGQRR